MKHWPCLSHSGEEFYINLKIPPQISIGIYAKMPKSAFLGFFVFAGSIVKTLNFSLLENLTLHEYIDTVVVSYHFIG